MKRRIARTAIDEKGRIMRSKLAPNSSVDADESIRDAYRGVPTEKVSTAIAFLTLPFLMTSRKNRTSTPTATESVFFSETESYSHASQCRLLIPTSLDSGVCRPVVMPNSPCSSFVPHHEVFLLDEILVHFVVGVVADEVDVEVDGEVDVEVDVEVVEVVAATVVAAVRGLAIPRAFPCTYTASCPS